MHTVTRRAALLGLCLAGAAVSGCSFTPVTFSDGATPTPGGSVDPTVTLDPEFFVRAGDGAAKTLTEGNRAEQRFSTPHLDGVLVNHFVGDGLSLATAEQVEQDAPIRAPEGHELAAFTLRGGLPSFIETVNGSADVQLRIGDRRVPLPNLFNTFSTEAGTYLAQWEMVCFCVPTGAEILLEVTDQDRTIVVDLRTGLPRVDEDWRATTGFRERWAIACEPTNGVFSRDFTTLPPPGLDEESGTLHIGLQPDTSAGMLPWTPAQGWAPDGQQWLVVAMNARVEWKARVPPELTINVPASFLHRTPDGAQVEAVDPPSITTDAIATQKADLEVVWPVSGRDTASTMSFNAVGELSVDYTDAAGVPAQFTSQAQPLEFALTATPLQR